jgi:hypothetical protein
MLGRFSRAACNRLGISEENQTKLLRDSHLVEEAAVDKVTRYGFLCFNFVAQKDFDNFVVLTVWNALGIVCDF